MELSDEINELVKCINTEDGNITVMFNTNIIENRVAESIARRPDIYLEDRGKKKGYIIDVTIVCDSKIREAYIRKVGKYYRLQERIRRDRNMRFVRIIPVVFTISGFIHKKSAKELKELGLKIDYPIIIKNMLVQEMKEVMYYVTNEMESDIVIQ